MRSWRVGAVLLAVAILLASAWASGWHRFTWGARSGTFGCVLAVLGVGLLWRHRQPELAYRPLHALLFAYWLAIGWVLAYEPMRRHGR